MAEHNRPSHTYDLPDRALDHTMRDGLVSSALPFAKKKALEILNAIAERQRPKSPRLYCKRNANYKRKFPIRLPA